MRPGKALPLIGYTTTRDAVAGLLARPLEGPAEAGSRAGRAGHDHTGGHTPASGVYGVSGRFDNVKQSPSNAIAGTMSCNERWGFVRGDRRQIQTAVLGSAESEDPLMLPLEAIELDAFRRCTGTTRTGAGCCSAVAVAG